MQAAAPHPIRVVLSETCCYQPHTAKSVIIMMDISMEHDSLQDLGHNVPYKTAAEKCINTYNGQNKKVSGHTTANHARIYI